MEKKEPSMVIGSWSLGDDLWEEEREQPSHHQSPTEPLPSLLRHATNNDKRILLQSPTNADSSSLILDLALSLASEQPCRCRTNDCEGCVAVCVLVLGNNDSPPFPKLCRPHVATNVAPPRGSDKVDPYYEPDHTQKQLLHRIQIRHVHTLQDILRYGLSLTGLPQEEVPMGGILVDGCLDRLVAASNAAHVAMQITQIGMLLLAKPCLLFDLVSCYLFHLIPFCSRSAVRHGVLFAKSASNCTNRLG